MPHTFEATGTPMRVKLTYFKPTGKFYASGEFDSQCPSHELTRYPEWIIGPYLHAIWVEVAVLVEAKRLPGLEEGHSDFLVSVDVPDHPHNHPHLIWPERWWLKIRDMQERGW